MAGADLDMFEFESSSSKMSLNELPTEIMFMLFEFVPPKDMIRCRQVCVKWRDVIDALLKDGSSWEKFCKRDYGKIYESAMRRSPNITSWYELYRSLSLWSQLARVKETIDEFCHSDTIDEEMRSAKVQKKGVIIVHKRTRVVYHDLMTLGIARRRGSTGQYVSLVELKDVVVMLGMNGQLHVMNKAKHDFDSHLDINVEENDKIFFINVRSFLVKDRIVFFSTYRQDLYSFHLDNDKDAFLIPMPEQLVQGVPDGLGAVGFSDGLLNIITLSENMYTYNNDTKEVHFKLSLRTVSNLMDCVYKHNMLEYIDWRHYYILMSRLGHKRHSGVLQFICNIHVYGDDLFFVGTQSGIVHIYYKPIIDGQLDLTKFAPIKKYNFSARIDIPILSVYPIVNIDVAETKDGHKVLVCMPRKILVITYIHQFEQPVSKAVIPYVAEPLDI